MNEEDAATPEASPAPAPAQARATRWERRSRAAADALRTLIRDLYIDRFGEAPSTLKELPLTLKLRANPAEGWQLSFDPSLADQLVPQVEDAQAGVDVFRKGHVHCFRCMSSACEHSVPGTPLCVFAGYDSTGRPVWHEFAQTLIALKDDRIDQLYSRSPRVLTVLQPGRELRGDQLASFGRASKSYSILGQVIAGYFPWKNGSECAGRLAVTMQIVEGRAKDGSFSLNLNVIARTGEGQDLDEALASGWEPKLYRAKALALREVESLEDRVRSARAAGNAERARDELRRVPSILRRLSDGLERGERQAQRRTRHAEVRRDLQRPVNKAFEEATAAKDEQIFYDEKTNTVVVCGEKGRAHVFNPEGKHVTSFVLKPDGAAFRLRTNRWRNAADEERTALRAALAATAGARGSDPV